MQELGYFLFEIGRNLSLSYFLKAIVSLVLADSVNASLDIDGGQINVWTYCVCIQLLYQSLLFFGNSIPGYYITRVQQCKYNG